MLVCNKWCLGYQPTCQLMDVSILAWSPHLGMNMLGKVQSKSNTKITRVNCMSYASIYSAYMHGCMLICLAGLTCNRSWIPVSCTMQYQSSRKHSYESTKHWDNTASTLTRPVLEQKKKIQITLSIANCRIASGNESKIPWTLWHWQKLWVMWTKHNRLEKQPLCWMCPKPGSLMHIIF